MSVRATLSLLAAVLRAGARKQARIYKLNLFATYRCNFRCRTCSIWKKSDPGRELAPGEYERLFSRLRVPWVDVSGGEIFLRPDIDDIFSVIIKSQKDLALLHFPTNGFFPDAVRRSVERILRTASARLMVTVSIDGPADVHNAIKGVASWERSVETYKRLYAMQSRRFRVFAGYTISDYNKGAFEATLQSLRTHIPGIGPRDIHINLAHRSPHYYANNDLSLDRESLMRELCACTHARMYKLFDPVDFLEKCYHRLARRYLETQRTPLACRALIDSVSVDPSGTVYPCTLFDRPLGNLRDAEFDLVSIVGSARAECVRREIKEGLCPQCFSPCEAYQMILASPFAKKV